MNPWDSRRDTVSITLSRHSLKVSPMLKNVINVCPNIWPASLRVAKGGLE